MWLVSEQYFCTWSSFMRVDVAERILLPVHHMRLQRGVELGRVDA